MVEADNKQKKIENTTEENPEFAIGERLLTVLEDLLKNGDWESSLFLRTIKKRVQEVIDETTKVVATASDSSSENSSNDRFTQLVPEGYMRVYVLLYQTEGNKLTSWQYALRTLLEYNTSRPTYKEESHVQELIRSKKDVVRYGYAVVNLKISDVYPEDEEHAPKDAFNHELLVLKENAIKRENIIGFVHSARRRYSFVDGELIYRGEI